MIDPRRIAEFLLGTGAVDINIEHPFTWTNGMKAPLYCDVRMLLSHPDARDFVVDALVQRIQSLIPPDCIAGTATAGIPWAALAADRLKLPFIYVRPQAKDHGRGQRIEGHLSVQKRVLVIEDLLSTAGSALAVAAVLREERQGVVTDIVSIMSYELLEAHEAAMEQGIALHPLTNLTTLLQVAQEQGKLSEKEVKTISHFAENPREWAAYV